MSPSRHDHVPRRTAPILWIAGLCALVEVSVWVSGVAGGPLPRHAAIDLLGFWPYRLGRGWPGDPRAVTMFATYWLIHAGPAHFLGNVAILVWAHGSVSRALAPGAQCEIWAASVLGGAVVYSLLRADLAPMIGASGGVFGLLGAMIVLHHRQARARGLRRAALRTGALCLGLALLSVADYILRDAVLAWQAHLGGFVAGAFLTMQTRSRDGAP